MRTSKATAHQRPSSSEDHTRYFRLRGQQQPRARDRRALEEFLADGPHGLPEPLIALGALVRDAAAMRPDAVADLRAAMERLQDDWLARPEGTQTRAAEIDQAILLPYLRAGVPLRRQGEGPTWAYSLLVDQLMTFDNSEMVLEELAVPWTRSFRAQGSVATLSRLAVAAGWLAWSHLIVEPGVARAFLNAQLGLIDRLDRQAHLADATVEDDDRAWIATALLLEKRLQRHLAAPPVVLH